MRKIRPLDALFPKTRQGILAALLVQSNKAWFTAEIARRLGVPSSSLQRELRGLTEAGVLKMHRQGRMAYYQANAASPLFSDLRGLMLKTAGLVDVVADVLKPLSAQIRIAFVFGSIAAGDEQHDSDIDLLLIGTIAPAELALPLRQAQELLGREINPLVYSPPEFRRKRAAKDHFLTHVLAEPKLFLLGNADELVKAGE